MAPPGVCVCGGEGPPRGYTTVLPSLGNRRKPPGDMGVGGGGGGGVQQQRVEMIFIIYLGDKEIQIRKRSRLERDG